MHSMQAAVADNSVTRTLALALRTIGSLERFAEYMGVPDTLVQLWRDGKRVPPTTIYMRALDLVARGPFAVPQPETDGGKKKA